MRIRHFMAGILGAAIALIVALALPSLAHAHAGHHHAPVTAAPVESAATAETAAIPVRILTMRTDRDAASPCGGLTCCTKACSACCVALSGSPLIVEPLWVVVAAAPPDVRVPAPAGPDDLSRPPKFLSRI